MKKSTQISESLLVGIILALAGGFMDAYSYICREQVFANAQTGNILLAGLNLSMGKWQTAFCYICPVLAFAGGIALADIVKHSMKNKNKIHWRQITILFEAAVLAVVSVLPLTRNLLANSLTSFACGIQVESFRKINGNGIATTMCIGNLRTATQSVVDFWYERDKKALQKGLLFYGSIICFVIGAVLGNICIGVLRERAILVDSGILLIAFWLMFIDRENQQKVKNTFCIKEHIYQLNLRKKDEK